MKRALLIVTGLVAAAVAGGADFLTEPASAQVISGGGGAGASVASGAYWYSQTYPNASVTGTAAETALADVAVPANALGSVGMLRITTAWTTTNTANNKSLRTRFSATANNLAGTLLQQSIANSMAVVQIQFIVRNAGATGSQTTFSTAGQNFYTASALASIASAIDTTQVSHVVVTGQLATSTETITLIGVTVEALHP